ncbi:MAG: hypothetical protein MUF58_03390 [Arcicella sp.]|nr:hypothetical protein [Arcicella sp.]
MTQLKCIGYKTADGVKTAVRVLVIDPDGGFSPRQRFCVNKYIVQKECIEQKAIGKNQLVN